METSVNVEAREKKSLRDLSGRQWMCLICLAIGNLGIASCTSLQAPFFPYEAEKKGATPSEYGLVFGLFYLTIFVFSPIFGKMYGILTPEFMRDCGMFVVGVCFILFGYIDETPSGKTFLILAYVIRIMEGIGSAAFRTSNFTLAAAYFPDNMATALGVLETTFGLGLIIGPTIGSALYEWKGYTLPFVSSGIFLILVTAFSFFFLPRLEYLPPSSNVNKSLGIWKFVKNPLVIIYIFMLTLSPMCLGFNLATLEPHLRQFHLSPIGVGGMFVISSGIYGFTSSIFGCLCDKGINPKILAFVSCLCLAICYTFIGPAPIFTFKHKLWIVMVCLVFFGTGFGGTRVIAYVDCLNDAIANGLPNDLSTSGVISGTFQAAFALGLFIGPTIGGIFLETIGYEAGSAIMAILMYTQAIAFLVFIFVMKFKRPVTINKMDYLRIEYSPLLEDSLQISGESSLLLSGESTESYGVY